MKEYRLCSFSTGENANNRMRKDEARTFPEPTQAFSLVGLHTIWEDFWAVNAGDGFVTCSLGKWEGVEDGVKGMVHEVSYSLVINVGGKNAPRRSRHQIES